MKSTLEKLVIIRGIFVFVLMAIITLSLIGVLLLLSLFRLFIPSFLFKKANHRLVSFIHFLPEVWGIITPKIVGIFIKTNLIIEGIQKFDRTKSYILFANHTTWADILIIMFSLNTKLPSLRFVMKNELKWQLPILSQACELLGFPFVKRYSKHFLEKNPHLKGKDIEDTKKTLKKFEKIPITIVNFIEGHRFSEKWHKKQNFPYQYLLKPRAGGISFTLAAMNHQVRSFINVTILYPNQNITMLDYLCNRIKEIKVIVEEIPISPELIGDYENDSNFRHSFQQWVNQQWSLKDEILKKHFSKNK